MEQIVAVTKQEAVDRRPTITITTFKELLKAISGELKPGEEHLLSIVVMDLFTTGRLEFIDKYGKVKKHLCNKCLRDDVKEAKCCSEQQSTC